MGILDGKVAIITGGAGNLGRTTAKKFLQQGAKVSLVDMDEPKLEKIQKEINSDNVMIVKADVTDENDVKHYVAKTLDQFSQIDIFFNNAGIIGDVGPVEEQTLENFNYVLSINLTGIFLSVKHVLPIMKKQENGSIINTSSVDGLRGSPNMAPYSISKHGVVGLTKTAARESAPKHVRVNSIHPAPVSGNMMKIVHEGMDADDPDEVKKEISKDIPMGHYADSDNIGNLVLFLASDLSEYITGSQYRVDGGMGATS